MTSANPAFHSVPRAVSLEALLVPWAAWAGGRLLCADSLPRPAGWWMTAVWWSLRPATWTTPLRSSEVSPRAPRRVLGADTVRAQRVGQAGRPQPSCGLWNPRRPKDAFLSGCLCLHFCGGMRYFSGVHPLLAGGACPPLTSLPPPRKALCMTGCFLRTCSPCSMAPGAGTGAPAA